MEVISVIIPIYNGEKFIRRCLDSIIEQTYHELEILVINDGSTDNSLEIVEKEYQQERRIKLISKENGGVSSARNLGITMATGKYVTFVDCDDWLEKTALEELYHTIVEKKVDVVRNNYYYNEVEEVNKEKAKLYDLADKIFRKEEIEKKVIPHFLEAKESVMNLTQLLLCKKELLATIPPFDTSLYLMEDVAFYMEMYGKVNSIYFSAKPLYHYYSNTEGASKSTKYYVRNMSGILQANSKIKKILEKNKMATPERIRRMNANHLKIITNYMRFMMTDNKEKAKVHIAKIMEESKIRQLVKEIDLVGVPPKNKIAILLIKYNLQHMLILYLWSLQKVYKIFKK